MTYNRIWFTWLSRYY